MKDDGKPGSGAGKIPPKPDKEKLDRAFTGDDMQPLPPEPRASARMPDSEPVQGNSLTDDLDIVFVEDDEEEKLLEPDSDETDIVLFDGDQAPSPAIPSANQEDDSKPAPELDAESDVGSNAGLTDGLETDAEDDLDIELFMDEDGEESDGHLLEDIAETAPTVAMAPPPPPADIASDHYEPETALEMAEDLDRLIADSEGGSDDIEESVLDFSGANGPLKHDLATPQSQPQSQPETSPEPPAPPAPSPASTDSEGGNPSPTAPSPPPDAKPAAKDDVSKTEPSAPAKPKRRPPHLVAKAIRTVKPASKTAAKKRATNPAAETPSTDKPAKSVNKPTLRVSSWKKRRGSPAPKTQNVHDVMAGAIKAHETGRLEEAAAAYGAVLTLDPSHAAAWVNLGVLNRRTGRLETAVTCLKRAVRLQPEDGATWSNLGNALRSINRLDDAIAAHNKALEFTPDQGRVHYNSGLALRDNGDLDGAIQAMRRAALLGYEVAELKWDLALSHLMAGVLDVGFDGYEARWQMPDGVERHQDIPAWDGSPLGEKTLLVWSEQGLGDTLHFCRYLTDGAPGIAGDGSKIILEVQPPLARLLSGSDSMAGIEIVARSPDTPKGDLQIPLLSLPRVLGTTLETIPNKIPYLEAPARPSPLTGLQGNGRMKVGLCWAGKQTHKNDRNRSISLSRFQNLFDLPGIDFFSFQKGPAVAEIAASGLSPLVKDLGQSFADFGDTAAALRDIDLLITVDTSMAHLAGSLGKLTWVMIPFAPDWRWMQHRGDSPWYPTMTLFRQSSPGDWDEVFERLRRALIRKLRDFEAQQATPPGKG